ncbi:hypothetical protein LX32DRAFT_645473 [Colletotrichum zoysiae]|uniref:Uncharacterized protein n=1 Tax=Colletotrichum zoysiae TaxID=1216348 RepID=A0AAD9H6V9_9PEZI|nr:hypothetical protein LX32DRAFT_645473 [Colletotrichum zoysiae]
MASRCLPTHPTRLLLLLLLPTAAAAIISLPSHCLEHSFCWKSSGVCSYLHTATKLGLEDNGTNVIGKDQTTYIQHETPGKGRHMGWHTSRRRKVLCPQAIKLRAEQ